MAWPMMVSALPEQQSVSQVFAHCTQQVNTSNSQIAGDYKGPLVRDMIAYHQHRPPHCQSCKMHESSSE